MERRVSKTLRALLVPRHFVLQQTRKTSEVRSLKKSTLTGDEWKGVSFADAQMAHNVADAITPESEAGDVVLTLSSV